MRGPTIDADSSAVANALHALVDMGLASGCVFHPAMRITERGGHVRVHCDDPDVGDGRPLAYVPDGVALPMSDVEFRVHDLRVVAAKHGPAITTMQRDFLDAYLEALAAAGTYSQFAPVSADIALPASSPFRIALDKLRREPGRQAPSPADAFMNSRVYFLRARGGTYLIPFLDLLDHHPDGSQLQTDSAGFSHEALITGPNGECTARYARGMDGISLALTFAYVDPNVRFARVRRRSVDIPGLGRVSVDDGAIADDRGFRPPAISLSDDELAFANLLVHLDHPERARTAVGMAVRRAAQVRGLANPGDNLGDIVLNRLIETELEELGAVARMTGDVEPDQVECAGVVRAALQRQVETLAAYRDWLLRHPAAIGRT